MDCAWCTVLHSMTGLYVMGLAGGVGEGGGEAGIPVLRGMCVCTPFTVLPPPPGALSVRRAQAAWPLQQHLVHLAPGCATPVVWVAVGVAWHSPWPLFAV